MARSYVLNYVHYVFSTKQRTQLIKDPESLWAYIRGIARNCKFDLLAVGGTVDHVHVLMALPANRNLADVMRDIKANSSRRMRELGSTVCVAGRVFRYQRESVTGQRSEAVYRESESTSSQTWFRRGVDDVVGAGGGEV